MDRSNNIFRPGVISRNPSMSRDSLRHYLGSEKIEGWQFSKLHLIFHIFFLLPILLSQLS